MQWLSLAIALEGRIALRRKKLCEVDGQLYFGELQGKDAAMEVCASRGYPLQGHACEDLPLASDIIREASSD